jgi:WYL domain
MKTFDAKRDATHTTERPSSWGQQQRLEFIEFRLLWEGRLNRSDLIEFFGISRPQASLDFARYIEMAPRNIRYDRQRKTYLGADSFSPAIVSAEPAAYLDLLLAPKRSQANFLGWLPPLGLVEPPHRQVNATILRAVLLALKDRHKLRIEYQSLSRPAPTIREISPHAIAYDGFRWHARAFCHEHEDFRDFVFARILRVQGHSPSTIDPKRDRAWWRFLSLILAPHPDLSTAQKRAIALDYGMTRGRLVLETRQALAFYVLKQLGLQLTADQRRLEHLVLVNQKKIAKFVKQDG